MLFRLLFALLTVLSLPTHAAGLTLEALMNALAANPGGTVRFVEQRHLAVLDAPLSTTGTLVYRRPDRLERHAETPRAESMVLEGDRLSMTRDGQTLNFRLAQLPEAAGFVDSIRAVLAGDRAMLERRWKLSLAGSAEAWTLTLLPADPLLAQQVERVDMRGRRGELLGMDVRHTGGDRSEMRVTPLVARAVRP